MTCVYLHIGTHKTGTTTIQKRMVRLQSELNSEVMCYPASGRPPSRGALGLGHHLLAWSLTGQRNTTDTTCWDDLHRELADRRSPRVILSAEHFDSFRPPQVAAVADRLRAFQVRIVVYLRNPLDFLISSYKQQIKSPARCRQSFREFAARRQRRCDYVALLEPWGQIFGREAVRIRLYDKIKTQPGLERDFLETVDLGELAANLADGPRANRSPTDDATRLLRLLNGCGRFLPQHRAVQTAYHRLRRRLIRGGGRSSDAGVKVLKPLTSTLYTEDDLRAVRERLRSLNHDIECWLPDASDREFLAV